jgi:hypothetical protein
MTKNKSYFEKILNELEELNTNLHPEKYISEFSLINKETNKVTTSLSTEKASWENKLENTDEGKQISELNNKLILLGQTNPVQYKQIEEKIKALEKIPPVFEIKKQIKILNDNIRIVDAKRDLAIKEKGNQEKEKLLFHNLQVCLEKCATDIGFIQFLCDRGIGPAGSGYDQFNTKKEFWTFKSAWLAELIDYYRQVNGVWSLNALKAYDKSHTAENGITHTWPQNNAKCLEKIYRLDSYQAQEYSDTVLKMNDGDYLVAGLSDGGMSEAVIIHRQHNTYTFYSSSNEYLHKTTKNIINHLKNSFQTNVVTLDKMHVIHDGDCSMWSSSILDMIHRLAIELNNTEQAIKLVTKNFNINSYVFDLDKFKAVDPLNLSRSTLSKSNFMVTKRFYQRFYPVLADLHKDNKWNRFCYLKGVNPEGMTRRSWVQYKDLWPDAADNNLDQTHERLSFLLSSKFTLSELRKSQMFGSIKQAHSINLIKLLCNLSEMQKKTLHNADLSIEMLFRFITDINNKDLINEELITATIEWIYHSQPNFGSNIELQDTLIEKLTIINKFLTQNEILSKDLQYIDHITEKEFNWIKTFNPDCSKEIAKLQTAINSTKEAIKSESFLLAQRGVTELDVYNFIIAKNNLDLLNPYLIKAVITSLPPQSNSKKALNEFKNIINDWEDYMPSRNNISDDLNKERIVESLIQMFLKLETNKITTANKMAVSIDIQNSIEEGTLSLEFISDMLQKYQYKEVQQSPSSPTGNRNKVTTLHHALYQLASHVAKIKTNLANQPTYKLNMSNLSIKLNILTTTTENLIKNQSQELNSQLDSLRKEYKQLSNELDSTNRPLSDYFKQAALFVGWLITFSCCTHIISRHTVFLQNKELKTSIQHELNGLENAFSMIENSNQNSPELAI